MSPIFRVADADSPGGIRRVLSANGAVARESGDGTPTSLSFALSLSPASGETVTVDYATADDTATGGPACATTAEEKAPTTSRRAAS